MATESSATRSRPATTPPAASTSAASIGPFESMTASEARRPPTAHNSSPVTRIPTRGTARTRTRESPRLASSPIAGGLIRAPAGSASSPARISSPARRMWSPDRTTPSISSHPSDGRTRSTGTTASKPAGIGIPVQIGRAEPVGTRAEGTDRHLQERHRVLPAVRGRPSGPHGRPSPPYRMAEDWLLPPRFRRGSSR